MKKRSEKPGRKDPELMLVQPFGDALDEFSLLPRHRLTFTLQEVLLKMREYAISAHGSPSISQSIDRTLSEKIVSSGSEQIGIGSTSIDALRSMARPQQWEG